MYMATVAAAPAYTASAITVCKGTAAPGVLRAPARACIGRCRADVTRHVLTRGDKHLSSDGSLLSDRSRSTPSRTPLSSSQPWAAAAAGQQQQHATDDEAHAGSRNSFAADGTPRNGSRLPGSATSPSQSIGGSSTAGATTAPTHVNGDSRNGSSVICSPAPRTDAGSTSPAASGTAGRAAAAYNAAVASATTAGPTGGSTAGGSTTAVPPVLSTFDTMDEEQHPEVPPDVLREFEQKLEADLKTVGVTLTGILGVIIFWRGVWSLLDYYVGDSVFGDLCCVAIGLAIVVWIRLSGVRVATSFWPPS